MDEVKKPRMGLVHFTVSYPVDLDDAKMVDEAHTALYEDAMNAIKNNELRNWIGVKEAPEIDRSEIPSFLLEDESEAGADGASGAVGTGASRDQSVHVGEPSHVVQREKAPESHRIPHPRGNRRITKH